MLLLSAANRMHSCDVTVRLLPWLLVTSQRDLSLMRVIVQSESVRSEPLFRCMDEGISQHIHADTALSAIFHVNGDNNNNHDVIYKAPCSLVMLGGLVVEWLACRTRDREVAGSTLGHCIIR